MSETVELTRFDVHNHKPTIKILEELALKEWIETARRSHVLGTKYYPPPKYPEIWTVDRFVEALGNLGNRVRLLEESMRGLGEKLKEIQAQLDSKLEEIEDKILFYRGIE